MRIPLDLPSARPDWADVAGLGENSLDLVATVDRFPEPDAKVPMRQWARLPGGQVATAMAACARLGWHARYVGRVGADEAGRVVQERLRQEGVDVGAVAQVPGVTTRHSLLIVDGTTGSRTVLWHRDPALDWPAPGTRTGPGALPLETLVRARVLLVDATDPVASQQAATAARAAGVPVIADVDADGAGVADLLRVVDIIIAAGPFVLGVTGRRDAGAAVAAVAAQYPDAALVCATFGTEGSVTRSAGREVRTPAFQVPCIDSTGAGDVFRAGFIAGWLAAGTGADLASVLRYASAAAALNCRGLGAWGGLPTGAEVADLLHST